MSFTVVIPKVIHQIWLGPLKPPQDIMNTWKEKHPSWTYFLWTENNIPLLKNQCQFDESKNYPQKSDILRYEILLKYGGIFIDADEYCLKSIEPILDYVNDTAVELFAVYEGRDEDKSLIANGVMGCVPNSNFMQKMVNEVDISSGDAAWEMVGPLYLTNMLKKYAPKTKILDAKSFFPVHHREKSKREISVIELKRDPDIYGIQLWGSTNFAYRPTFLKNPWYFLRYWNRKLRGKMFIIKDL